MSDLLRTMHVAGVVVLIGNVTATSIWKVFADRTRNPIVILYAQRMVTAPTEDRFDATSPASADTTHANAMLMSKTDHSFALPEQ